MHVDGAEGQRIAKIQRIDILRDHLLGHGYCMATG
jgi:hypothetical protein